MDLTQKRACICSAILPVTELWLYRNTKLKRMNRLDRFVYSCFFSFNPSICNKINTPSEDFDHVCVLWVHVFFPATNSYKTTFSYRTHIQFDMARVSFHSCCDANGYICLIDACFFFSVLSRISPVLRINIRISLLFPAIELKWWCIWTFMNWPVSLSIAHIYPITTLRRRPLESFRQPVD